MTIYFPACSAERKLAWSSLNSHPFVCHGVYLYIANLHQANLMAQKREKEGGKKKSLWKRSCCQGPILSKQKRHPTRSIHMIYTWSGGSQHNVRQNDGETALRNIASVLSFQSNEKNNGLADINKWSSVDPGKVNLHLRSGTESSS